MKKRLKKNLDVGEFAPDYPGKLSLEEADLERKRNFAEYSRLTFLEFNAAVEAFDAAGKQMADAFAIPGHLLK